MVCWGAGASVALMWRRVLTLAAFALVCTGTVAQLAVSGSGSPSYSHPISVPPGVSGMQPNLSLMYSGGGVNGPVGHGWSVQGISMITRCPATRTVDGAPRGVRFDQGDKLCLDGQRLIQTNEDGDPAATTNTKNIPVSTQVNDAQGLATGEYREFRTEKDSFARIRAYGMAGSAPAAANGPAYFRVWTKAGQIYEYGAPPNVPAATGTAAEVSGAPAVNASNVSVSNGSISPQGKTVVMVWAVARVSDVVGNYIDFKYEVRDVAWGSGPTAGSPTLGREWNIAEIQYTGNTGANSAIGAVQAPANKIVFRYTNRPTSGPTDVAEAYQQGSKNVSVRLLDRIETYINSNNPTTLGPGSGVKVRSVNLSYDTSTTTKRRRLTRITECVGSAANSTNCAPPVVLNYASGGNDAFTANTNFSLQTTTLFASNGVMGVVPIDFDGDGKTDLLRWSDTPSENQLWKSNGDGSFTQVTAFNITATNLFRSDGCFATEVADFNGDGIPDLLRLRRPLSISSASCPAAPNQLYLGSGSGAYSPVVVAGIDFSQWQGKTTEAYNCLIPFNAGYVANCLEPGDVYLGNFRATGKNYYLLDVNGDGLLDIVTTILPGYGLTNPPPANDALCAPITCSRVYLGSTSGAFTELTPSQTNLTHISVYSKPRVLSADPYKNWGVLPAVADVNGDGYMDLMAQDGVYLSKGTGDFDFALLAGGTAYTLGCENPLDFNGDGRADCLSAPTLGASVPVSRQGIRAGDGTNQLASVANFNLTGVGQELSGTASGYLLLDVNGDGRTDIVRWKDDATQNVVYLSNGDGSFTASATFNLVGSPHQLGHSDGQTSFVPGDFLGNGTVQILRLKASPVAGAATSNQLYVKSDVTPQDQLVSAVSPSGLKTTLTYATLANAPAGRYASDRGVSGQAASYPLVDLTIASPVVITSEADSGIGAGTIKTEYAYRGLKAAADGRGMLGFRQSVQQSIAPNGEPLTVITDYLLNEPYSGVARRTQTRRQAWNSLSWGDVSADPPVGSNLLSWTTNTYCDRASATNPASATPTAPCATTAKVRRPYLRQSVEDGKDLFGNALPTVTTVNTFDDFGNATVVVVTSTGSYAGLSSQTSTKTTTNVFCAPNSANCPNKTSADNWILGRLNSSVVSNQVSDVLNTIARGAGSQANATATTGTQNVANPINPAVLTAIHILLLSD